MSQFNWAFSTHFCPIKKVIYLATLLDRKFRLFKNSPNWDHFRPFLWTFVHSKRKLNNVDFFGDFFKQRDFAIYWSSITLVKGRKSSWKSPHSEGGGDNSCHWSSLSNRCLIWCLDILMQGLQESNWWNTWAGQKLIMYHAHDPPSRLCTSSVTAVKALAGDFWGRQEVNHFLPSLGLRSASSGLLMTKWSSLRPA